MTLIGMLHLASALYLSAVICLGVSVNENRQPGLIFKEFLRRWAKFIGLAAIIAVVVYIVG